MTQPRPRSPRSLRWQAYGLVRPLVRPIAWRLRTFFAGPLQDEVRALRHEVEALRRELAAREEAVEPRITAAMEQMLLALALDHEARRGLPSESISAPVRRPGEEPS